MIEWVFFDVGSVLFNDAPQDFAAMRYFHSAIIKSHPTYTLGDMLAEREERALRGESMILAQIVSKYLSPEEIRETYKAARRDIFPRYDEHNIPFEDLLLVLGAISKRFRLGIVANQPPECRESLKRRELLQLFEIVGISEELNLRKPDPAIFEWAIDKAQTSPDRIIMVGDRRDNDITPAANLGMPTVWLNWQSYQDKNWFPDDPDAKAFLASCDRVPFYGEGPPGMPEPDAMVHRLIDVPAAVEGIAGPPK